MVVGKAISSPTMPVLKQGRLNDLAAWLPQYASRIEKVINRLWDLHPAIKDYVYHPEFYGSFSLKAVLPALVPHMTYEGMDVADGIAAGLAYEKMIKDELTERGIQKPARCPFAILRSRHLGNG